MDSPFPNGTLPPARLRFASSFPHSTSHRGPSVQMPESSRNISHFNYHIGSLTSLELAKQEAWLAEELWASAYLCLPGTENINTCYCAQFSNTGCEYWTRVLLFVSTLRTRLSPQPRSSMLFDIVWRCCFAYIRNEYRMKEVQGHIKS